MISWSMSEFLSDEQIIEWILDLSEVSDVIKNLSSEPFNEVVWQKKAKVALENILEEIVSGVNIRKEWYDKPIASMIFAWPSWVWKTLLARVTQKILNKYFKNNFEIIKVNCADFAGNDIYSLNRITWAAAWFIGSNKKPTFHPDNINWKWRVILFDEIEKAWPPFWNILLSVLDDGTLDIDYTETNEDKSQSVVLNWKTVNTSEISSLRTSFKDTIVIMTSNVWNDVIEKERNWTTIWFSSWNSDSKNVDIESIILSEFWKQFRIEMQGRYDYIIPFDHLTKNDARKIIDQLINRIISNTLNNGNWFVIEFTEDVKEMMTNDIFKHWEINKFWWRSIENYFKKNVLPVVARAVNSWKFKNNKWNSWLLITTNNWEIVFSKISIWELKDVKDKVKEIL
jgi:ATP-dependent Clp protease ATP-binding subunit ClpA